MHPSVRFLQGCILMTILATTKPYRYPETYSVTDDVDEDEDDSSEANPQQEDYTKYFEGSGSVALAPQTGLPGGDSPAGFVQPIDFSAFFAGSSFGPADNIEGIVAPPIASNLFGLSASHVLPVLAPGLISGQLPSASNSNYSSHVGFINPHSDKAFQTFLDSTGGFTRSGYGQPNFLHSHPSYSPTTATLATSPHSLYLPHFEQIKATVGREVAEGQKQVSLASNNRNNNKSVQPKRDNEYYNNDEEEEDDDQDENDDEEEIYGYDEPEEKLTHSPALSESHPGKSSYPLKSKLITYKKNTYNNVYPNKPTKMTKPDVRPNIKHQSPYKKEPHSPGSDYGYRGSYDYPQPTRNSHRDYPEFSSRSTTAPVVSQGQEQQITYRKLQPAVAYYNKQIQPLRNSHTYYNSAYKPTPQATMGQTIYPTFTKTQKKPFYPEKQIQPTKSIYSYSPVTYSPVSTHGEYIPSSSIPYAENFPSTYRIPYSSTEIYPSSILPENPKITADSSKIAQNTKRCIRIQKKLNHEDVNNGGLSRQPMTCYACHDVATGANFEQCSYDSESKPNRSYETHSQTVKAEKTIHPFTYRRKRDIERKTPDELSFPSDSNVGERVTLIRKVREYTEYDDNSHTYDSPYGTSEEENYRFGPEYFTDSSEVEGESTQEVSEQEPGENCRKVKKDGINCVVCHRASGGVYEQCSYASDPKENSYSYGTSRKYGRGSRPQSSRSRRFTDTFSDELNSMWPLERKARHNFNTIKSPSNKPNVHDKNDESYENPENFSESKSRIRKADRNGGVGLDPFFYGSPEDTFHQDELKSREKHVGVTDEGSDEKSAESQETSPSYEDYFSRLFPELSGMGKEQDENEEEPKENYPGSSEQSFEDDGEEEESQQKKNKLIPGFESSLPDYFDGAEQRKDLEEVLGEFSQKDRTDCKKVMRDKMTCYQCLDSKGMQHEECMFVAASEPKGKHLAYHEVKQFRLIPKKSKKLNTLEKKLSNRKPVMFNNQNKETDHKFEATVNNDSLKNVRKTILEDSNISKLFNSDIKNTDNDSQAAENLDILKLKPKEPSKFPVSTLTIQNQRYFSSTGFQPEHQSMATLQPMKETPAVDDTKNKEINRYRRGSLSQNQVNENYRNKKRATQIYNEQKKKYNPIPTEPQTFEIPDGPEGAYSKDTETAYDTVLKISLPRYMLEKSEHERIFDEVLASG